MFDSYLNTSRDELTYTSKKEVEILEMAKKILIDKYNIEIISTNPFKTIYKSSK